MIPETSFISPKDKRIICKYLLIIMLVIFLIPEIEAQYIQPHEIIFVQLPQNLNFVKRNRNKISSSFDRYIKDSRIIRYNNKTNSASNLTPDFYAASDPDISFDGNEIIFCGKKSEKDNWQIWSMNTDGSGKKQLTFSSGDCWMPVYAGNRFYLNDPEPTPQIVYAGNEHSWYNDIESTATLALYGIDHKGKQKYRLTYNLYSDFSPDVLPDGRLVFTSWQPFGGGKLTLMSINVDGTDLMPYYGNHEMPRYKEMAHVSDYDANVHYIEYDEPSWLGGGDIASLSHSRPLHSYRQTVEATDKNYHSPCPLPDGSLLASVKSDSEQDVYVVYHFDSHTGDQKEKIYGQVGWHTFDTQILAPHPQVKGRSNWLIPGAENGVFYCLNSYRSNLDSQQAIKSGQIKYVRIIEGLIKTDSVILKNKSGFSSDYLNPGKVLGTAQVEPDGSFHVRVPAETPLRFQLLDENNIKIKEQSGWTWVMGNENRGCIGCHENRELSPPNVLASAIPKPPTDLTEISEQKNIIDFVHQIYPVINSNCASSQCHGINASDKNLRFSVNIKSGEAKSDIYHRLLTGKSNTIGSPWLKPGHASQSALLELVKIVDTGNDVNSKSHNGINFTKKEKLMLIEWIDLGAAFDLNPYMKNNRKE